MGRQTWHTPHRQWSWPQHVFENESKSASCGEKEEDDHSWWSAREMWKPHKSSTHDGLAVLFWFSPWGCDVLSPRGTERGPNFHFLTADGEAGSHNGGVRPASGGGFQACEQNTADLSSMTIWPGATASTTLPWTWIGPPGVGCGKFFHWLEPLSWRQLRRESERRKYTRNEWRRT